MQVKDMKKIVCTAIIGLMLALTGCSHYDSKRALIEERKAAIRHRQDSALAAARQELAVVDSALEAAKAQYERMSRTVEQHREQLTATEQELTAVTRLRIRRDSLKVRWDVLGAQIKYIKKLQEEGK